MSSCELGSVLDIGRREDGLQASSFDFHKNPYVFFIAFFRSMAVSPPATLRKWRLFDDTDTG